MARLFDHIDWHLQIRATEQRQVDQVIDHFGKKAGVRTRVISSEDSWRVKNLHDVKLTSPLNCREPEQAIFRLLLMMREVASGWQIKGPIDYEDNQWLFGGLAAAPQARIHVPGVEWINVEMRNFPLVQRDKA
jgi:hypothetical protein